MHKEYFREKWPYFLIGSAVFLLVCLLYSLALFAGPESFLEDRLVGTRPVSTEIIVVSIDDESISRIGQWPWPRSVFADAFLNLEKGKPLAVALDVMLSEPSRLGQADDEKLSDALNKISYPLIMPAEGRDVEIAGDTAFTKDTLKPLPIFTSSEIVSLGHVNLLIDKDGIVRKFPRAITDKETKQTFASFAKVAVDRGGFSYDESAYGDSPRIVYSAPPGGIRHISFWRLLEDENAVNMLKNKLVFIGATAPDLHDEKPTPFSEGTEMPGVEIEATIANMFISEFRLEPIGVLPSTLLFFLLSIFPVFLFIFSKESFKPLFISIGVGSFFNIFFFLLFDRGLIVNLIDANLAWMFSAGSLFSYRYLLVERNRREIRYVFGKYVSSAVLEAILANPEKVTLGGEEKTITVLFSDIRGFTTLSEKTTPPELVSILNKYFTLMTGEVMANGGVLDKYIGDAVMAFWGAPLPDIKQADNALKASLGMLEKLEIFNDELMSSKGIKIDIGIGLYTGPAVVGNIGSLQRFDYTAMGDTVNVASRLEGLNKEYGTHLIVGETTKAQITLPVEFKKIGEAGVKGRAVPITIYTLAE